MSWISNIFARWNNENLSPDPSGQDQDGPERNASDLGLFGDNPNPDC